MEVSVRRSAKLPCRPLCAGGVYVRSSPVSLCSPRGSPGALDSDVYWPAQLCCVWPQDLELTTNGSAITRTVALFIQAPAQDPLVSSSTRQCSWLQLWVSCTVVRRCFDCTATLAPTTNVQTRLRTRRVNDGSRSFTSHRPAVVVVAAAPHQLQGTTSRQ